MALLLQRRFSLPQERLPGFVEADEPATSQFRCNVGGSSKGDLLGEQKETALEGEFSEDIGPAVEWRLGRGRHYPELALGMIDEGHGVAQGGTDLPTAAEEVDLGVGVEAAAQVQSQMEVHQGWVGAGLEHAALFLVGFGAGLVWGEAGGAADGAVLGGAEAAFDFALGLRAWSDQVSDAQCGQGALELGAGVAPVGGGLVTEEGEGIGVEGHG